ncbi:hypothetical protein IEE84_04465 [Psychrobacter sp. 28M-43]|uniref:hypothetical protein n=1 Tax=Psychrobacter sp. 28M-43 TaxID=2772254 RepID=UPI00168CF93A|nr:hypothetical protein [Psychrobacter sp. 28M-43]QOD13539.1 hypothetical protein IEE84_04465 [Psychrobacter sp. 28M-43]
MTNAFDIPNYIQGHIFKNQASYYDAAKKEFIDQAGYGDANNLKITTGTPNFQVVSNNEGLLLDNTYHGKHVSTMPWQGSMVVVLKPNYTSGGTLVRYLTYIGNNANAGVRAGLQTVSVGGNRRVVLQTGSGVVKNTYEQTGDGLVVIVYALDQKTRKCYMTVNGVNVFETYASSSNPTSGNEVALSSGVEGAIFGNINGVIGDTTAITDFNVYMFEQHFYAGNIITENLADTKKLIESLKAKYA